MSFLKFKPGAVVHRDTIIAAAAVNARNELGLEGDTVVTSGNDSKHKKGSAHYKGNALDFRVHGLSGSQIHAWAEAIRRRLGGDYDVIVESLGAPNAHIHVEFDPKD